MVKKSPIKDLVMCLKADKGYKQAWRDSLSMAFQDEIHRNKHMIKNIADKAADNFLEMLCKE